MEKLKFEELNISKEILRAIDDMGFEEASPIQSKAIPYILEGRDIIGQAQTGTGKTAAFGIPTLDMVNIKKRELQAVILCPTRELAIQIAEEFKRLLKYKKSIDILPVYGGQPIERQLRVLKKGVHVVIGTPGRVKDHINRNTIILEKVKMVVLDEADEMLDMGFREDIEFIINKIPIKRQTLLFSATMPRSIMDLTKRYQVNPELVKVIRKELTVPTIEQGFLEVHEQIKPEVLSRLMDTHNPKLSLVFCNTKKKVDELVTNLQARGYLVGGLHGDMRQSQRDIVMGNFRKGAMEILVATDVAARGIDVDDVDMVFNYDMPQDEEYYVHRIGRTGRAGRKGKAFTFVVGRDIYKLRDIQRYAKTKIEMYKIPSVSDIENVKANSILENVKEVINEGHLSRYINLVEELIENDNTSLDVAAALLKILVSQKKREELGSGESFVCAKDGMVRMFLNIGKIHELTARDVVAAIAGETGVSAKYIGKIVILERYSFVEIHKDYAKEVILVMNNSQIKGRKVNIEPANSSKK